MKRIKKIEMAKEGIWQSRMKIWICGIGIFAICLLGIIFRMQIFGYEAYQEKVIRQITVGASLPAERGLIYDSNGVILAENKTVWRIYISPVDIKKAMRRQKKPFDRIIADGLSEILNIDAESIYAKAQKGAYLDQTILRGADEQTVKEVLQFAEENDLSDMIHTEAGTKRYYPFSSLAAHTIGFTGNDNQGLFGLEAYYDRILTGTDGRYVTAVDSQGIKLPSEYRDYVEAEDGLSIKTTLDVYLQKELEHQLEQALIAADAQNRVTGVVMNVKTGAILAMATAPTFDLNDPYELDALSLEKLQNCGHETNSDTHKQYKNELLYTMWNNKAVSEVYEPGSTFKIITASIGLETGAISPSSIFHCPGYYMVGGCRISCHKHGGHGTLDFTAALQQSCNPAMMQTAERIGAEDFYRYFMAFGYGEKTGIDLPGEGMGLFHSLSSLGSTELATSSFGQRFKVSVLQQLCAVATVANGGIPVTPHLLDQITDKNGKVLYTYEPVKKDRVISEQTANTVSKMLEGGVSGNGGAKNAYVEGYQIAAKTGTSEKFEILNSAGQSYLRIGSCVAFAPYDDAEIAVIIIVDEPTCQIKYGSAVAAPYIGAFLSAALPYLGVEPQENANNTKVLVSDYTNKSVADAKNEIKKAGLSAAVIGNGTTVIAQTPSANTYLSTSTGQVILYTEQKQEETTVPFLIGKTLAEANVLLTNAGLNITVLGAQSGQSAQGAVVTEQSLPPQSKVPLGTPISIRIFHMNDSD